MRVEGRRSNVGAKLWGGVILPAEREESLQARRDADVGG